MSAPAPATVRGPIGAEPDGTGPDGANRALTPRLRTLARRRRPWIVIAGAVLLGALVLAFVQGVARPAGTPMSVENAAPGGARALAQVLAARGVEVVEVRSLEQAERAARGGATVLLHDAQGLLGRDGLADLARAADRLVVARPDFAALEVLAPGVRLAGAAGGALDDVGCDLPAAERAGGLSAGQGLLTVDDEAAASGFAGCFADDEAYAVVTGPAPGGAEVALVGSTAPFVNETVGEAGNAALVIGLLGTTDELAWYLPGPADADVAAAPTLQELIPGWVSPVLVLAALVVVSAGIQRGRRFGPLVVEDLPVHVPAGETGEGRARLYARSSARVRALDQLRIGTVRRLQDLLRLPRSAHVDVVVTAAAAAIGRDAASVRRLLVDDLPGGDRDLVSLARDLDDLERRVRAALRPDSPDASAPTGRRP
ncbi:DUF4350 domain-containing protein [Agromyces indicus]|uniref:DUF4350 domain-containing protein n=1 Tax=Agromyces indicus TaxID=758919 RepID=A0ABU1FNH5_9MICO|nr:DUF4350 domain-containing protein [Agromyces indicus]MDR5693316.1 DUF4350 domain-containing protein [Agromyces indicus]